jgi:hypothetical protein
MQSYLFIVKTGGIYYLSLICKGLKECTESNLQSGQFSAIAPDVNYVRFKVLTAASMMFRIVFWDVLPCKISGANYFTRQYIPEDNSEQHVN